MASNQTKNYGLNQWERTDKVVMEDFNADNAAIDAALGAADARAEALAKSKADQSALAALQTAVNGKASQSDLTSLQNTVSAVSARAGSRVLASNTLWSSSGVLTLNLSGVDWSQYSILVCYFYPVGSAEYREPFRGMRTTGPSLGVAFPLFGLNPTCGFAVYGSTYVTGSNSYSMPSSIEYEAYGSGVFEAGTIARAVGIR